LLKKLDIINDYKGVEEGGWAGVKQFEELLAKLPNNELTEKIPWLRLRFMYLKAGFV
jgi:hypothetical protein